MNSCLITSFVVLYFCYFVGTHDDHITRQRRSVLESKHAAELSAIDELLDKLRDENAADDTNRDMDDDIDIEAVGRYIAERLEQRAMKKETMKKTIAEGRLCPACFFRRFRVKKVNKNINY